MLPQIVDGRPLAAVARKQQPQAKADHADNRQHFNERKPEFGFAVQTHVHQVDGVNDNKEGSGPDPGGNVG